MAVTLPADLDQKTRRAWFEYRAALPPRTDPRYDEVEPWAWAKLKKQLDEVEVAAVKARGG